MYVQTVLPKLDRKMQKLIKKDRQTYDSITEKMKEIISNPHHYKQLGNVMHGLRRVHFGSYVLTYGIDEPQKLVVFVDFEHHDKAYKN